jgi:phosphoesterase RecJ-like protein
VQHIRQAQAIAVATHISPDPDAIGSAAALGVALTSLGKRVVVICDDPVLPELLFIPGAAAILPRIPDGFVPDLFIAVDASDRERLGEAARPFFGSNSIPTINLDHHITNSQFAQVNVVDVSCAAASEVVLRLIDALSIPVTQDLAAGLLAALVGDTRAFSTASVTARTLAVAARLAETGADVAQIIDAVFARKSVAELKLWGIALSNLRFEDGIIWAAIPLERWREEGLSEAAFKGVSNLLVSAGEASISAAFFEKENGHVEISLRARTGFDVAAVALALGGGGHPLAAGCTLSGPLDAAAGRVVGMLKEHVRERRASAR